MDFSTFQENCKHAQYGLKQDTVRYFELTCRNPAYVRQGNSWEICDEAHCPYFLGERNFGVKITSGAVRDAKTGEVLLVLDGCGLITYY